MADLSFFTQSRLVQAEPRGFSNWARGFAVFVRAARAAATLLCMDLCRIGGVVGDGARPAPTNVCFWPKADILIAWANVRFRGNNGHGQDIVKCPFLTTHLRSVDFHSTVAGLAVKIAVALWVNRRGFLRG